RRKRPDHGPLPAAAAEAGEQVPPGGSLFGRDNPDRPRQQRPRELLLKLEQALGPKLFAERLETGEQVPLPRQPHVGGAKREARRRVGAAGVVVGPTGYHDFDPVAQSTLGEARALKVVEPDRTGDGALGVAELEIGLDLAAADPGHLTDQPHPRPAAELL